MMNTTPFLPSPETTLVIVLGASEWPFTEEFRASGAFKNAASKLTDYFLHTFGLPQKNLLWLFDTPLNALDIDKEICRHLDAFADQARDVLIYYTGHGGLTDDRKGLYLVIRDTQEHDPENSSLRLKSLAKTLKAKARHLRHFYILDCCFAASGQGVLQGTSVSNELFRKTLENEEISLQGYAGLFSSGKDEVSVILPTDKNTYFTEALLGVLLEGVPDPKPFLFLKDVYMPLEDRLLRLFKYYRRQYPRTQKPPKPQLYAGDVASLPFFPNLWTREGQTSSLERAHTSSRLEEERRPRQLSLSPAPPLVRSHRHPNVPKVLITFFFLLVLLGGGTTLFFVQRQRQYVQITPTFARISTAYDAFVAKNGIQFGFTPSHTRVNPFEHGLSPSTVPHLKLAWTAFAGLSTDSSPVIANGIVYIGSYYGSLYAFDAVTGKSKWVAPTGNLIKWSSPAVADGTVYIGSDDGKLYAFNAASGRQLWASPTGKAIDSSSTVVNGVVYIGSEDGKLYAFNAMTGAQLWATPTGGPISTSSPAVANGVVYIGSEDLKLHAFNATTGTQLWVSAQTSSYVDSSPAVVNGVVYVGSDDDYLYAFDAATGEGKWVSAQTGGSIISSPAVVNGVVYVGSTDGKLYAFDAVTGRQLWVAPTGKDIWSSPIVANGVVYVGSYDNKLYAFNATTGKQLWASPPTDYYLGSSPTVANGMVYVGSERGKLYAFSLV
jgi:outer membrane protein assembly factor BamB